ARLGNPRVVESETRAHVGHLVRAHRACDARSDTARQRRGIGCAAAVRRAARNSIHQRQSLSVALECDADAVSGNFGRVWADVAVGCSKQKAESRKQNCAFRTACYTVPPAYF